MILYHAYRNFIRSVETYFSSRNTLWHFIVSIRASATYVRWFKESDSSNVITASIEGTLSGTISEVSYVPRLPVSLIIDLVYNA